MDAADVSISKVELTVVGRASVADASVSETVGVELTTADDGRSSALDGTVSKDVETGGNELKSVGTLTTGFTEDSIVAEVGMALPTSLARLESISVGAESGIVADSDVAVAS